MITKRLLFTSFIAGSAALLLASGMSASAGEAQTGTFTGASNHVTTGEVSIVREGDSYVVKLGDNFNFDGAPDPKVALGANGYDKDTILGVLASDTGAQSYAVPEGVNPEDYNEVWIWCEQYNVPLGKAVLN